MKRTSLLFFLFLVAAQLKAQSFLDDPFLYLYLGKRANEYSFSNQYAYNNYGYARTLFHNPLSGMQLNDQFIYPDLMMNGKGSFGKYAGESTTKRVYSLLGTDLSLVNGGGINHYWGKKVSHTINLVGVHRWKKEDHPSNGWADQPGRNDLNLSLSYRLRAKRTNLELGLQQLSENTRLQPHTGNPSDSLFQLDRQYSLTQAYLRTEWKLNDPGNEKEKRNILLVSQVQVLSLQDKAKMMAHRFDSDQQALIGNLQYRNLSKNLSDFNFTMGAEYQAARVGEKFDAVATVPITNVFGTYATADKQLTDKTKFDVIYRADLVVATGQWLHNPGIKWTYKPIDRFLLFAYTQVSHRMVNTVPEYMAYLGTEKNVYRNPVVRPDEFVRSGVYAESNFYSGFVFSASYHFDFYTLRNVADVRSEQNTINFYRARAASFDHVAEGKISWNGYRWHARLLFQYTASKIKMKDQWVSLPFYSPVSSLASVTFRQRNRSNHPEAGLSVFYSARFITGTDLAQNNLYSKPGFSVNLRGSLPMLYVSRVIFRKHWPDFVERLGLVLGCDNVTGYKQNSLYTFSTDSGSYNAINTWGQYFGRRGFAGLSINLGKRQYYY